MSEYPPIIIDGWFQGPTGSGQGGWSSYRFAEAIGQPVTVAIRRPIPLDTPMRVVDAPGPAWHLIDPAEPGQPVLIATRLDEEFASTEPVSIEAAAEAKTRFPHGADDHPVPFCYSCGTMHDAMGVQAGALADGRYASTWAVPEWAVNENGAVDLGTLWSAIDCTQAFYVGNAGSRRTSLTVQLAVEVLAAPQPGQTYAIVGWHGTYPDEWDGRKRGAGGAAFDASGRCIARSSSFWLSIDG